MKELHYIIADLEVVVAIPDVWDESRLLASCEPFKATNTVRPRLAEMGGATNTVRPRLAEKCSATVRSVPVAMEMKAVKSLDRSDDAVFVDAFDNEAGKGELYKLSDGSWIMEIEFGDGKVNRAHCSKDFAEIEFWLNPACKMVVTAASTLMRSCFAQRVLRFDGISMHSSTIICGGKGYMFLGKSGTGKSTHSRQWLETFENCTLLNDDNPIVRRTDTGWRVYGSPWSGKTACYVNDSAPLAGIVRLSQAPENRFSKLSGIQAWIALSPSCSVIRQDAELNSALTTSLNHLATEVTVGGLCCLPDHDAALTCKTGLDLCH